MHRSTPNCSMHQRISFPHASASSWDVAPPGRWCHFMPKMGIPTPPIQKEAMQFLQGHPWPGNVRELENAVRRALLVRPGYPIALSDVHSAMAFSVGAAAKHEASLAALVRENLHRAARGESVGVYNEILGIMERELFLQAIKLARGNQVQAARWLGISRLTLRHRLRGLGLDGATLKTNLG